ncbi:MAG: transposase [Gammaproteobacteria bacterium]|nr:transposase [Gammaproteobacteria bacterium]
MGYGTDISDEEWVILAPFLEPKQKGRPRKHSLRRMVDAIRYMQRTGCQWRLLPKDFPPWRSVYVTFWRWRKQQGYGKDPAQVTQQLRVRPGRTSDPTLGIIEQQPVGEDGALQRAARL